MLERWRWHTWARQGLWALVLLLVLAQSVGLIHRYVHASHLGLAHAQVKSEAAPGGLVAPSAVPMAPWAWVFGEHKSSTDCQLYDQVCQHALGVGLCLMPLLAWHAAWLAQSLRERWVSLARFFSARAPPAVLN